MVINVRGSKRRLVMTVLVVFAIVAVFVVRLVDIQVVRAEALNAEADKRRVNTVTTYGVRGSIVDASGEVLADSVERFDITASPKNVKLDMTWMTKGGERVKVPTTEAIQAIADLTGADPNAIYQTLASNPNSDFAYLEKAVTLDVFKKVRELQIPWVYSNLHPARTYPSGAIAGNLVGFIGTEGPQAGTEFQQEGCLGATNGHLDVRVKRRRRTPAGLDDRAEAGEGRRHDPSSRSSPTCSGTPSRCSPSRAARSVPTGGPR